MRLLSPYLIIEELAYMSISIKTVLPAEMIVPWLLQRERHEGHYKNYEKNANVAKNVAKNSRNWGALGRNREQWSWTIYLYYIDLGKWVENNRNPWKPRYMTGSLEQMLFQVALLKQDLRSSIPNSFH